MRNCLFILFLTISLSCSSEKSHIDRYLEFMKSYPHLGETGNYKDGKIEIILERSTINKIEETQANKFIKHGETKDDAKSFAKIGIIAKDNYWIWIRDAVIFPSGATGTFDRIIKTKSLEKVKYISVAVLPVTEDNKIVLNILYRHAIRGWVMEIPRGGIEGKETPIEAGKRELKEETGLVGGKFEYLGNVAPDSGTVASIVPCYYTKVGEKGFTSQDYTEAIVDRISMSKEEVKDALVKGYVELKINNKNTRVAVIDGYLSFALLLAETKKLI